MVRFHRITDHMHQELLPTGLLSSVVDGCMKKRLDVTAGGARYNFSGMQFVQPANLIDSFQVLKELVYSGKVTGKEFLEELQQKWKNENLRLYIKHEITKY